MLFWAGISKILAKTLLVTYYVHFYDDLVITMMLVLTMRFQY